MILIEKHLKIINGENCPYCFDEPEYVDSEEIYGKSYGMVYLCRPCNAYVGVHKGTNKPLGRLANKELRKWKKEAHEYFDKIWKLKINTRKESYKWLSIHLDIPSQFTHIGMFGVDTCKEVVRLSKQLLNDNRRLDLDFGAEPVTPYYETE